MLTFCLKTKNRDSKKHGHLLTLSHTFVKSSTHLAIQVQTWILVHTQNDIYRHACICCNNILYHMSWTMKGKFHVRITEKDISITNRWKQIVHFNISFLKLYFNPQCSQRFVLSQEDKKRLMNPLPVT